MATYKEIFGTNIEVLASDPANPVAGQVWYNSTDNVVKGQAVTTVGSWATGASINGAKQSMGSAGSTSTAGLIFGGRIPAYTTEAESYNGTSWTEVNDLNAARDSMGGAGATNTASLAWGGRASDPTVSSNTETWNGTSWTEVNNLNLARAAMGSSGGAVYTAAITFGGSGIPLPTQIKSETETWNGTSWTEVNNLNTARFYIGGIGSTSTAALGFGGYNGTAYVTLTESWNGTSWTEVNDLNTPRGSSQNAGSQPAGLTAGGSPPNLANTEEWNGTSWTETTDVPVSISFGAGFGSSPSAVAVAGLQTAPYVISQNGYDWLGAGAPTTVTFTDS
jgi:hypothetical protein